MNGNNRTGWTVLAGFALIGLGIWLLLGRLFVQVAWLMSFLARIGWPLLLVGIGILLIIRARGGGFDVQGKKFYRSRTNRMIGGVIGGAAAYLGVDAPVLRVIYAFVSLFTGVWYGLLLYIIAMLVLPEEPYATGWENSPAANAPAPPAPPVPPRPDAPTPPPAAPASYGSEPPAAPPVPPSPTAP